MWGTVWGTVGNASVRHVAAGAPRAHGAPRVLTSSAVPAWNVPTRRVASSPVRISTRTTHRSGSSRSVASEVARRSGTRWGRGRGRRGSPAGASAVRRAAAGSGRGLRSRHASGPGHSVPRRGVASSPEARRTRRVARGSAPHTRARRVAPSRARVPRRRRASHPHASGESGESLGVLLGARSVARVRSCSRARARRA